MKALVFHGPNDMRWQDWANPEPQPDEVMLSVRAVGICGSDVHGYAEAGGRRVPPMIMGHEAVGEVTAVGSHVSPDLIGRLAVVFPAITCGSCDQCQSGNAHRCRNRRFLGATNNGAMADSLAIPAGNVILLPDAANPVHYALTEPLAVAIHAANRAGDLAGKAVLIAGSGPIGLLTLVAVREMGAGAVVMTDLVDGRLDAARKLGATCAVNPSQKGWQTEVSEELGTAEFDVAFDAVGVGPTFEQALCAVRPGGIVVAVGGWQTIPVQLPPLVAREIKVQGTFNFTRAEFELAKTWLAEERLDPAVLISHERPLHEGADTFARLADHSLNAIKVVLTKTQTPESNTGS